MVYCNIQTINEILNSKDLVEEFYKQTENNENLREALFIRKNQNTPSKYNLFILEDEEGALPIENFYFLDLIDLNRKKDLEKKISESFEDISPIEVRIIKMNHNTPNIALYIKPYSLNYEI